MKSKSLSLIIITSLALFYLIISSIDIFNVEASRNHGAGASNPVVGGLGSWMHASSGPELVNGSTGAWKSFEKTARWGTEVDNKPLTFERIINTLPHQQGAGGSLVEQCKKSQFIWWYSKDNKGISTKSGLSVHPPASKMPYDPSTKKDSQPILTEIIASFPKRLWSQDHRGGIVLVCSWSHQKPVKEIITLTAKSGEFDYDGTLHEVKGFDAKWKKLNPEDRIVAEAYGARKEVGEDKVIFNGETKVMRGKKDVTNLYILKHEPGTIRVFPKDEKIEIENCRTTSTETIRANVINKLTVTPGYIPSGGLRFDTINMTKENDAYKLQYSPPRAGGYLSEWIEWKSEFLKGNNDLDTKELKLGQDGRNIMNSISEHGGVINVLRTHNYHEVTVELCQPQERDIVFNEEINDYEYGPWYDSGEERITRVKYNRDPENKTKNFSYQIIGVNCNEDGVSRIKSEFEIVDENGPNNKNPEKDPNNRIMQTVEKEGIDNFILGSPGHYTGEDVFYKPDGKTWRNSCADAFKGACTPKPLSDSKNDSKNNLVLPVTKGNQPSWYPSNFPLFAEVDKEANYDLEGGKSHFNGYGLPDTDENKLNRQTALNFFRDNEERVIRSDIWRLDRSKVPSLFNFNEGDKARETQVRFTKGTPELEVTEINAVNPRIEFTLDMMNEKGTSKTRTYRNIEGELNQFTAKSKWSSDENKPYELHPSWGYKVWVYTTRAAVIDGIKVKEWTLEPEYVEFIAHCPLINEFLPEGAPAQVPDNPYLGGSKAVDFDSEAAKGSSIKIQFNRSVSDKSDTQQDNK